MAVTRLLKEQNLRKYVTYSTEVTLSLFLEELSKYTFLPCDYVPREGVISAACTPHSPVRQLPRYKGSTEDAQEENCRSKRLLPRVVAYKVKL